MSYLYIGKDFVVENVKKYAVARVARVIPLFLLVVIFSYIFQLSGVNGILYNVSTIKQMVSHVLLVNGTSVLWTIGPEFQFYIFFILVWKISSYRPSYISLLLVLVILSLYCMNFPRPSGSVFGFPYDFPIFRSLPYFMVGVIFGQYYGLSPIKERIKSDWYILSILVIPFLYPKIFFILTGVKLGGLWNNTFVFFVLSFVFFCVVYLVPDENIVMSNKVGDFFGKISYSLYLIHIPILWQIKKYNFESIEFQFFVFIFCCVVLSFVSYRLIEVPCSRLIRKVAFNKYTQEKTISLPLKLRS